MTKPFLDDFPAVPGTTDQQPPLSQAELSQLRAILRVVRYDAPSETLRIDTGKARILVRGDGSVRVEGRKIAQVSQGPLVLNGAVIELN